MFIKKTVIVIMLLVLLLTGVFAQEENLTWNGDSKELEVFLKSENDNQKVYAMQQIIINADQINVLHVSKALYNVFCEHQNDKMRLMALVALYKTNDYFMLKNLTEDLYREKDPEIRKLIVQILDKIPILDELN